MEGAACPGTYAHISERMDTHSPGGFFFSFFFKKWKEEKRKKENYGTVMCMCYSGRPGNVH
jgi:hypothetical protein